MRKKLLICGGTGFIGRNCIEYFLKQDKYEITATYFNYHTFGGDKFVDGVNWERVDLRVENEVKKICQYQDIIIQAAASTTGSKDVIEKPYYHVTDNAVMNSWLFREAMLNKAEHLIFLSCTVMYQSKNEPQKETDWSPADKIPEQYFGVGNMKVYSEHLCEFYAGLGQTKYTAIRHSNVYGSHDKFDLDKCHVVPALINKVINTVTSLEVWGTGKAKRDILYINDLVKMIDATITNQKTKYELFNCGKGAAISITDLAETIKRVNSKRFGIEYNTSKPDIPTVVVLDCEKAKNMLGWKPETSLENGLRITSEWYKHSYKK